MLKECNTFIKARYDRLDETEKAGLEDAAEEAKSKLSENQADVSFCNNVPVRDAPKAAQIRVINSIQNEIANLQNKLRNYQMGMFVAYVPMNKDCALQKPSCDRNSPALQAYFLNKEATTTGSMLLRAKKFLSGAFISLRIHPWHIVPELI